MKIKNFKMIDNDKFKKGIHISFKAQNRRTDNPFFLDKTNQKLAKWIFLIGKNSSGKSSIYHGLLSYFMAFNPQKWFSDKSDKNESNLNNELPFYSQFRQQDNYFANLNFTYFQKDFKAQKNQETYKIYFNEPQYEIQYFDQATNCIIKHIVIVKKVDDKLVFDQKIEIITSQHFKNMLVFSEKNVALLSHYDLLNNDKSMIKEKILRYIDNTASLTLDSDLHRNDFILQKIDKYKGGRWNSENSFIQYIKKIIKVADPNFLKFDFSNGTRFRIKTDDIEKNIDIESLSTGTRIVMGLAIRFFEFNIVLGNGLFIMDEFDANINKQLAWDLIIHATQQKLKNFQGIATSHSPTIFDQNFRYDLLYEIYNDAGAIEANTYANKYNLRSDKNVSKFFDANFTTSPEEVED